MNIINRRYPGSEALASPDPCEAKASLPLIEIQLLSIKEILQSLYVNCLAINVTGCITPNAIFLSVNLAEICKAQPTLDVTR